MSQFVEVEDEIGVYSLENSVTVKGTRVIDETFESRKGIDDHKDLPGGATVDTASVLLCDTKVEKPVKKFDLNQILDKRDIRGRGRVNEEKNVFDGRKVSASILESYSKNVIMT